MNFIKDWVEEVANEICNSFDDSYQKVSSEHIKNIVLKHCPFEPDTAYMKVPNDDQLRYVAVNIDGHNGRRGVNPDEVERIINLLRELQK